MTEKRRVTERIDLQPTSGVWFERMHIISPPHPQKSALEALPLALQLQ